jgi:hypothetical protein
MRRFGLALREGIDAAGGAPAFDRKPPFHPLPAEAPRAMVQAANG